MCATGAVVNICQVVPPVRTSHTDLKCAFFILIIYHCFSSIFFSVWPLAASLNKCRFPSWLANYNHWHSLDYTATYSFHHRNSTLRITNSSGLEMKVVCAQLKHTSRDENSVVLLTHFTMGWYVVALLLNWLHVAVYLNLTNNKCRQFQCAL